MNRELTNLEYKIHNILKLSIDPVNISIIDSIKLLNAILNNDLNNIIQNTEITSLEKYYLNLLLDQNHIDFIHITTNYFNNLLLEWYFILSNAFLYNDPIFDIMLENKEYLLLIEYFKFLENDFISFENITRLNPSK